MSHQRVTVHFISTHFFKAFVNIWAAPSITIVVGAIQRHSQKLQQPHLSSSNTTTSTHSKILFPQLPSVDELVPYCEYQYQSLRIFYLKVNCCYLLASGLKSYLMVRYFSVCSQYVMQCQDGICHVTLSWSCHVTWNCHKVVIWCDKFLGDWNHIWC